MNDELIRIYREFGFEAQLVKLMEEAHEFKSAFYEYRMAFYMDRENKDQFMSVLDELNDMVNVAYQIGIVKYGLSYAEIEAMRKSKVNRTMKIINIMDQSGETYDEVRERVR